MQDKYIATPYKAKRREIRKNVRGMGEKGKSWETDRPVILESIKFIRKFTRIRSRALCCDEISMKVKILEWSEAISASQICLNDISRVDFCLPGNIPHRHCRVQSVNGV
jgi:hypothetical protein